MNLLHLIVSYSVVSPYEKRKEPTLDHSLSRLLSKFLYGCSIFALRSMLLIQCYFHHYTTLKINTIEVHQKNMIFLLILAQSLFLYIKKRITLRNNSNYVPAEEKSQSCSLKLNQSVEDHAATSLNNQLC